MRAKIPSVVRALFLIVTGAWGVLLYLDWTADQWLGPHHDRVRLVVGLAWVALFGLSQLLDWKDPRPAAPAPSPPESGLIGIGGTGLAATIAHGWNADSLAQLVPSALALLATAALGLLVWRFAARRGPQAETRRTRGRVETSATRLRMAPLLRWLASRSRGRAATARASSR